MAIWLQSEGKERRGDRSVPRLDPALAAATHPCRGGWPCLLHDHIEHLERGDACDDDDDNKDDDDNQDVDDDGDHGDDDGDGDDARDGDYNASDGDNGDNDGEDDGKVDPQGGRNLSDIWR